MPMEHTASNPGISRRRLLGGVAALGACAMLPDVSRGAPLAGGLSLRLHDQRAQTLLNRALSGNDLWLDASVSRYSDRLYDEIRVQKLDDGYITMITGESDRDFHREAVASTIFDRQDELPRVEDGAMSIIRLGQGVDPALGLPYRDTAWMLDFLVFYGTYTQRMYRTDGNGVTILSFELLDPSVLPVATREQYATRTEAAVEKVDRRWPPFDGIVPVSELFGMFVVTPGTVRQSRVTFVCRLSFDASSGLVPRVGSQLPPVLRGGLQSGFESCVKLVAEEQTRM